MSFALTTNPIQITKLSQSLRSNKAGAFVAFEGWVRDHHQGFEVAYLEYEAENQLCENEYQHILFEAKQSFEIIDCKAIHRIGRLEISECAVWVGVISAHRDAAFKAARYIIDQIKSRLPIWKKEIYEDGSAQWINHDQKVKPKTITSEIQFYSKQLALSSWSNQDQEALKQAKVAIVGAGGLGCPALLSLASAGIGHIAIIDSDRCEESNLHRQTLYAHHQIGQFKALLAKDRLKALNPYIHIDALNQRLTEVNAQEILNGYDYILDCTDNLKTKYLLMDYCEQNKKYLIQASVFQFEGQLSIYHPEKSFSLKNLWDQNMNDQLIGNCEESGVLGITPSLFGQLQANETIKLIRDSEGQLINQVLLINLIDYATHKINIPKHTLVSDIGKVANIEKELNWINELSLETTEFIDIREKTEVAQDPINNNLETTHLPLSNFDIHKINLQSDHNYLLFCQKGIRSLKLATKLQRLGYKNIFSLKGGFKTLNQYSPKAINS